MDHNHSEDRDSEVRSTELGSPRNDQVLAQVKQDLRDILDNTIHPLCDQADAQNADLPAMMAVLATSLDEREDWLPRPRMASLLALLLIVMAARERVEVSDEIGRLIETFSSKDPIILSGEGAERAAEILVRREKAVRKHASPGCACGTNMAGEEYVDPICRPK